jgi:hypothetical protein
LQSVHFFDQHQAAGLNSHYCVSDLHS